MSPDNRTLPIPSRNNVQIGMRYLREDRVAIIDNGINSNLMCKEKIQSQMVIDLQWDVQFLHFFAQPGSLQVIIEIHSLDLLSAIHTLKVIVFPIPLCNDPYFPYRESVYDPQRDCIETAVHYSQEAFQHHVPLSWHKFSPASVAFFQAEDILITVTITQKIRSAHRYT